METITTTDNKWFNLSDKLADITLTNDKTYILQTQENQIRCFQGSALPTGISGLLLNPVIQSWKFTYKTGDVIGICVIGNMTENYKLINHITIAEVK